MTPEEYHLQVKYGLTTKEARATYLRATTGQTPTECAQAAGYSAPRVDAVRLFRRPHVNRALVDLMAKHGITEDRMMAKASQLLDAQTRKDGRKVADNSTQLRMWELLAKCVQWLSDQPLTVIEQNDSEAMTEALKLLSRYQTALASRQTIDVRPTADASGPCAQVPPPQEDAPIEPTGSEGQEVVDM